MDNFLLCGKVNERLWKNFFIFANFNYFFASFKGNRAVIHKKTPLFRCPHTPLWNTYPQLKAFIFQAFLKFDLFFTSIFYRYFSFLSTFFHFEVWTTPFYPHFRWIKDFWRVFCCVNIPIFDKANPPSTTFDKVEKGGFFVFLRIIVENFSFSTIL